MRGNSLAVADSETLGRYDDAIVLSVAVTISDLTKKISFMDLVNNQTFFIKLDAMDQAKRGRAKEAGTVAWWNNDKKVSEEARKMSLYPDPARDINVDGLADALQLGCHRLGYDPKAVDWCDRNLFDLRKMQHIIEITCGQDSKEPWDYHHTFDIVSWFKGAGMTDRYAGINPRDIPEMVYHDPRHDAALDWLRMQSVLVNLFGLDLV